MPALCQAAQAPPRAPLRCVAGRVPPCARADSANRAPLRCAAWEPAAQGQAAAGPGLRRGAAAPVAWLRAAVLLGSAAGIWLFPGGLS